MTVKQLREALEGVADELLVVTRKPLGNFWHEATEAVGVTVPARRWDGRRVVFIDLKRDPEEPTP
jgi:hypothetical protein